MDLEKNVESLLDNYADNKVLINKSKKNIHIKLTILLLSLISSIFSSLLLIGAELPVILVSAFISFTVPQLITLKMQGSYYKNVKNILISKKNMSDYLSEFNQAKDIELTKEKELSESSAEEIDKHNLRQKELEMAFSDENYYPYIERIKTKTLKR